MFSLKRINVLTTLNTSGKHHGKFINKKLYYMTFGNNFNWQHLTINVYNLVIFID